MSKYSGKDIEVNVDHFLDIIKYYDTSAEEAKKAFFVLPGEKEYDLCNRIIDVLKDEDVSDMEYVEGNVQSVILKSVLDMISLFGDDIGNTLKEKINGLKIENTDFECHIAYDVNSDDGDIQNLRVESYGMPRPTDERTHVLLAHEHAHALKDTNPLEIKYMYILGDVIPIFVELMLGEVATGKTAKYIYNQVISYSLNDISSLDFCSVIESIYPELSDGINNVYQGVVGHIISFYYAIMLYDEYRKNKEEVYNDVKAVLNNEMTTIEVLEKYKLLDTFNANLFRYNVERIEVLSL